ncbi:tyrosine-type recombinase/integrase [Fibrella forsythiae]|uniref:Tyrosine-type recombinase/integrase n=1 Tax=Fibrella forsythiae TaxID=2817061 RepID=A0ABS3JAL3_9BACT|nr:tyrosine-type recombinase/integrase [Fibrella forsythiae]MBO0947019.1 tyrosine-type recombinase/integrase [Fibrella forsythiae]
MNVRFIARPSATHTTRATLQCRISVNGVRSTAFSTGIELSRSDWNARLQQIKGRSDRAQTDTQRLEWVRSKLYSIYHHFEAKNRPVTADMIRETYVGKRRLEYTLNQLLEAFLLAKEKSIDQPGGITKTSFSAYQDRLANLVTYLTETKQLNSLLAEQTNVAFVKAWQTYLLGKYKVNYVGKHIDLLKQVLDYGVMMEHIQANRLHGYRIARVAPDKPIYLTKEQIDQLEMADLSTVVVLRPYLERMKRTRTMFLFMCATGMHWIDYTNLTADKLHTLDGQQFLITKRQKSEKELIVPVTSLAARIIDQVGGIDNLPKLSNQKMNTTLKLVALAAGIKTPLTSKVGRKSFTDFFLNEMKWDKDKVAKMLGLSNTKYLAHYGDIDHRSLRLDQ